MSFEYALETKLQRENPELHQIFSNNVLCSQNMLNKYKSIFPSFTDHTALHSIEVIDFCNQLVGDNIDVLNADEIFCLLMAAYLHDSGMGISLKDYEIFLDRIPGAKQYIAEYPKAKDAEVIRRFHHEFSGEYIKKYESLFDFPSKEHLYAVIQISRGHRKMDLFDDKEYPSELAVPNGNVIHLPYLSALLRMADEIDIAADRNIQFLYDISLLDNERDVIEFSKHKAIKQIEFNSDALVISVDFSNEKIRSELDRLFVKLRETLDYCVEVVEKRSPFVIHQSKVEIKSI